MITNTILAIVTAIVSTFDKLFPDITLPSWLTSGALIPTNVQQQIAAVFVQMHVVFPSSIDMIVEVLLGFCELLPFLAAWTIIHFVITRTDQIEIFGFKI